LFEVFCSNERWFLCPMMLIEVSMAMIWWPISSLWPLTSLSVHWTTFWFINIYYSIFFQPLPVHSWTPAFLLAVRRLFGVIEGRLSHCLLVTFISSSLNCKNQLYSLYVRSSLNKCSNQQSLFCRLGNTCMSCSMLIVMRLLEREQLQHWKLGYGM